MSSSYTTLRFTVLGRRGTVAFDHPPINLLDGTMFDDLSSLCADLESRSDLSVLVFESAVSDFFIAHADVRAWVNGLPESPPPAVEPNAYQALFERYRRLPQATIAMIAGHARGGGCEFALALDMRFAVTEQAVFGQPEIALGAMPGFGGTQYLARLVGRGRALEIVLSGRDLSAREAAEYGLVNKMLPESECAAFVDSLANQIASFPPASISAAKRAVLAAEDDHAPGLVVENNELWRLVAGSDVPQRMRRLLELGGQTREFELEFGRRLIDLGQRGQ